MGQNVMGIDMDSLKPGMAGVSRLGLAERAKLQMELKECERLMPHASSGDLMRWLGEQRAKAVESMVSARDDETRVQTQAFVQAWDRIRKELEAVPKRYEQVAAMLQAL
jgi:hypothetical protein